MGELKSRILFVCVLVLLLGAPVALGDWDVGDGHKMHYPQLPKEGGLDVALWSEGSVWLADDWQCSETGPVEDIHFWVSWHLDDVSPIGGFSVRIWSDDPCGLNGYSEPNELLWERDFDAGQFTVRDMPDDSQGWFAPFSGSVSPDDHIMWQQINIEDINNPFIQQEGEVYWLMIDMWGAPDCGWKESGSPHFRDNGVYWDGLEWVELVDPMSQESLDLAFVITGDVKNKNLKWSQPPIEWDPMVDPPRYCGWDEVSYLLPISTPVYQNWDAIGFGSYYAPGGDGYLLIADDINLAGTERKLDHYDFTVYAPVGTAPYIVLSRLCTEVIDPVSGYPIPGAPIPGTFCAHNVLADGYITLDCAPGTGAILPDNLWMELSFDADDAGWVIGEQAELGFTADLFSLSDGTGWGSHWFGGWPDNQYASFEADIWCESEQYEGPMAADDYRCLGSMPVTSVHWWGSHLGWEEPDTMPQDLPIAWRIGFWTNVPAAQHCDFLYGAATGQPGGNAPSSLYKIDPSTGVATLIGPIGFNGVTGLSFAPDGTLYGTCRDPNPVMGDAFLITIDTTTGAGTAVGRVNTTGTGQWAVPDISFRSNGVLYGIGILPYDLITIDTATGLGTSVGPTGYLGRGNGMDFAPNGTLYATPSDNLSLVVINPATGAGSDVAGTVGNVPFRINALEFCESTGVLYGSWNDSSGAGNWKLVTIDLTTGLPTVIGPTVDGLDAITFNTFSHPNDLLWQIEVPADRVDVKEVGVDEYPEIPYYDICYQYYVDLEPNEIFWQGYYETMDDIFWLSIAAIYDPCVEDPCNPWGWKTRPWSWMDDAVRFWMDGPLEIGMVLDPCEIDIEPIEEPIFGESFDLAFELDTDPCWIKHEQPFTGIRDWPHYEDQNSMAIEVTTAETITKYIQPPDLSPNGVDVDATTADDEWWSAQILADDFNCTTTGLITDIHIWGSWYLDYPFPNDVDFYLSIWSDRPVGPSGWSEPNEWQWGWWFDAEDVTVSVEANDLEEGYYVPCEPYYEHPADTICYRYDFYIDPFDAFMQQGSPDEPVVYWLVVEAYPREIGVDEPIRFGWKTTDPCNHFKDDAVWSDDWGDSWNELLYPAGHPYDGDSIDLAFKITTEEEETEFQIGDRLVADDWPCDQNTPITAAVWWGSYIGYRYAACNITGPWMDLPVKPKYFWLTIWDDVPAGADPYPPVTWSHPNDIIWEYKAYDYDEVLVGYDKYPEDPGPGDPCREPVFRYSVRIPEEDWFCQEEPNNVYWFSVVAVYDENTANYDWGWTNHEHMYNDDAVAGHPNEAEPSTWWWEELYDQTELNSVDMSFILFTEPEECYYGMVDYSEWVIVGKPICWCYPRQCHGDSDGLSYGFDGFWVSIPELTLLKAAWNKPVGGLVGNEACADSDHLPYGFDNFRVSIPDLTILKNNWNDAGTPADCLPGNR